MKKNVFLVTAILCLSILLAGCGGGGGGGAAKKEEKKEAIKYPVKPINLVVPFAAGGSSDMSARAMADEMAKLLGQPMVVVNRGGAGGGIGAAEVAKAKPDGYTILNASLGPISLIPYTSNVGYDYPNNLKAVSQVTNMAYCLSVHKDSPIKDLKGFIEYAKANPGKIRYGNPGAGSIQHVVMENWSKKIGIKCTTMPFEGNNPAVAALLGNHIEATMTGVPEIASGYKSGMLRVIGVTSDGRDPLIPDVPTFKEQGYDLVDGAWYGFVVPKETPDEVVAIIADAMKKAYESQRVQDAWKKLYLTPEFLGPKEFDAKIRRQVQENEQVLKDIGMHRNSKK